MATPQIPGGQCPNCQASIIDLFAEWTDEYQTAGGKKAILAGDIVFDCYYCQEPVQLVLPLALIAPVKAAGSFQLAKRSKVRCQDWLISQHPGHSLSEIVVMAAWQHHGKWAFDGYNWKEGDIHRHGQDAPPTLPGGGP
jgi:hypothetical protein